MPLISLCFLNVYDYISVTLTKASAICLFDVCGLNEPCPSICISGFKNKKLAGHLKNAVLKSMLVGGMEGGQKIKILKWKPGGKIRLKSD